MKTEKKLQATLGFGIQHKERYKATKKEEKKTSVATVAIRAG